MNPTQRIFLLSSVSAALLLAGCKDASQSGPAATPAAPAAASAPVSIEAIAAEAQGFSVGSAMSARTVYVFFDPQCPHCAALWVAAKPLKSQARFVWIPVGLMNANSTLQGAAILASPDPVTAMDGHEVSMREKRGGIAATGGDAQKQAVARNTQLMNKFGFASIPTIVARHAQSGETIVIDGSMPTAALAAKLGLQAPS